jgi:hypothetical protein
MPSQDAVSAREIGGAGLVAAVADGHGHWRHFRSARGAQIAVEIGCALGADLAGRLAAAGHEVAGPIRSELQDHLVPELVNRWREVVLAEADSQPLTADERELRLPGDDPTVAYGTTLLLGILWNHWLLLAQIGDGDIVCVQRNGTALLPVPDDPQLDGRFTTSLCGPDAVSDVRIAVVDTRQTPLVAVLLATDGYGNAQVADPWAGAFSKDLAELLARRGPSWLAGQLPTWVARCASPDGSADDTSVALLLAPAPGLAADAQAQVMPARTLPLASEAATIPAQPHQEDR